MNRLQSQLSRLYLPPPSEQGDGTKHERPTAPTDKVRVMILEVAGPADWTELSKVWRGVQADLRLPAPAIAVSGSNGMQLWFSLQEQTGMTQAADFLTCLRTHYLPGIALSRVLLQPSAAHEPFSMPTVPQVSELTGNWSAFIASDLASVFVDTPWLDIEPSAEGQADLLSRLESIRPSAFDAAMQTLSPAAARETPSAQASNSAAGRCPHEGVTAASDIDPRRFLQQVLNDESAELALRIAAAKALLRNS
jgi:hypothetical protein